MPLLTLFSVLLNIYLVVIVWGLRDEMGTTKWVETFVSPLFKKEETRMSYSKLLNSEKFLSDITNLCKQFSKLPIEFTYVPYFGVVDDYFKACFEFCGDEKNLEIFKLTLRRIFSEHIFLNYNFSTTSFVYETKLDADFYRVTILFSLDEKSNETLGEYISREKELAIPNSEIVSDASLEKEFNQHGI